DGDPPTIDDVAHGAATEVSERQLVQALGGHVQVHPRRLAAPRSGHTVALPRAVPQGLLGRDEGVVDPVPIKITRRIRLISRASPKVVLNDRWVLSPLHCAANNQRAVSTWDYGIERKFMGKDVEPDDGAPG